MVAYGSEYRPVLEAVEQARERGLKAGLLKLKTVWPVPEREIKALAEHCDVLFTVEMNTGKYAGEVERVCAGACDAARITKNRGLIHTPGEILEGMERKLGCSLR
jgi:2-oxoglutarate ferredoxin oxidoreductase subunit alpha